MNDSYEYDLIQARLHMRRKQWDKARALLEALYTRDANNLEVKGLLLQVEKEQAFQERETLRVEEMDPREIKDQMGLLVLGVLLVVFMFFGGFLTAAAIHAHGWHTDVILQSSVSRNGQHIEYKLPVSTMLGVVPLSGLIGAGLIRWSLRDFRIW